MNILGQSILPFPKVISCPLPKARPKQSQAAFTLVELLAVIGIIVLMSSLVAPAFNSMQGAKDIQSTTSQISGVLEQARAYAMANNTYVYVGFQEVDVSNSDSLVPQVDGKGRVAVAVVASKDGTRGISTASQVLTTTNMVSISKLQRFENADLGAPLSTGNMARSTVQSSNQVSDSTNFDLTSPAFYWPLTANSANAKYSFKKVIEFDPQGIPRPAKGGSDNIVDRLEVGLLQTKGNLVLNAATAPQSAIMLDGVTGAVQIYRP